MNWAAQVVHSLRKDLRQQGAGFAGYAAIVLVATVRLASYPDDAMWLQFIPFMVTAAAFAVLVANVHADPPARATSFWGTRPIAPSALLTAKVIATAGVIVLALAGQGAVLHAAGIEWHAVPAALAISVRYFVLPLCMALVIAACTHSTSGFVVLQLCVAIGLLVVRQSVDAYSPYAPSPQAIATIGAVAGAAFLALAYMRRDLRLPMRVLGIGSAALLLAATVGPGIEIDEIEDDAPADAGTAIQPRTLHARLVDMAEYERGRDRSVSSLTSSDTPVTTVPLRVGMDSVPNCEMRTIGSATVRVTFRNGERVSGVLGGPVIMFGATRMTDEAGAAGMPSRPGRAGPDTSAFVTVLVDSARAARIPADVASATLSADVLVWRPRVVGNLLADGAMRADRGVRVTVDSTFAGRNGPSIAVTVTEPVANRGYGPNAYMRRTGRGADRFVLVDGNGVRHAVIEQSHGGGSAAMLLPGAALDRTRMILRPTIAASHPAESAGGGNARLAMISWQLAGSYHVTAPISLH